MLSRMNFKEMKKYYDERDKFMYKCNCSRKVLIPYNKDYEICSWCGARVYKSEQIKFKYVLKDIIKKNGKLPTQLNKVA